MNQGLKGRGGGTVEGWRPVAGKQSTFTQRRLMLTVLQRWAGARIQIKSINKDTFCFHLKLSPLRGPPGGEVTIVLSAGRPLGLITAHHSGVCCLVAEQAVRS